MPGSKRSDASIQAFFAPQAGVSSRKQLLTPVPSSDPPIGDGFTAEEVEEAVKPKPAEPWHPPTEYVDTEIRDLYPGPGAVTFMGRVANVFDVANTPKTPRSAKGCVKLCVKDSRGAITVRVWYASRPLIVRLGALVSIWTTHVSNGEHGVLSSASAPLFTSLFPERDRNCHIMVHENSDDGVMYNTPLGYREGLPLNDLMTLQNFVDGGYDVVDARILVVVRSIGAKKRITRKDQTTTENINLQVHDDTATATLGLWGTATLSPLGVNDGTNAANPEAVAARQGWRAGETVLLLQSPGWKFGRTTYLSISSVTVVDVDPCIPDTAWLQRWSLRQKSREAINPSFPENVFDISMIETGPRRCLFTIAELDEFARAALGETFQGYLSVVLTEVKLLDYWKRQMLLSGECCNIAIYANSLTGTCKGCDKAVTLRLNPRIIGQVMDETAAVASGKLLLSETAWRELLGRGPEDLLKLGYEEVKYLADRLLFCRVTMLFGWAGDESKAGGRICVLGVRS